MAFCKYCGRKLEEGESCTCEEAVKAAAVTTGETPDAEAGTSSASEAEKEGIHASEVIAPPVPVQTMNNKILRRGLILMGVMALCLVLFVTVLGNIVASSYKLPVRNVERGLNKDRAELIINSFYPRDYIGELRDDAEDMGDEWSDVTDDMDSLISEVKEVCEDNYFGDDIRVSAKIVKKKSATARDLRMLKKEFEKYDAVAKKAYRLKICLTVKGGDQKKQIHFYIYSVKIKGGKWLLYADDKTKGAFLTKTEDVYKEIENELNSILSDYSDQLGAVIPNE